MAEYAPDNWVILKINDLKDPHYRVLGGWYGGYLGSNSWRLNSGITRHDFDGDYWFFYGSSGSCYKCYVDSYRLNLTTAQIFEQLKEKVDAEIVEDQAWIKENWDWIIK
jgi:hypothetical protein